MTNEQAKLIEDSRMLVYKFLSNHGIYDEDMAQELLLHLCTVIDKYDPSIAAYSTWLFAVCNNKMHHLHKSSRVSYRIPQELVCSLNAPISSDSESNDTLLSIIPDSNSDTEFRRIENISEWEYLRSAYIKKFKKYGERDMDIIFSLANGVSQSELAQKYGTTRQNISLIFNNSRKALYRISQASEKIKKSKPSSRNQKKIGSNSVRHIEGISKAITKNSSAPPSDTNEKILYKWLYGGLRPSEDANYEATSTVLAKIASKELKKLVPEAELKKAMAYCGYYAVDKRNNVEVYGISTESPILKRNLQV